MDIGKTLIVIAGLGLFATACTKDKVNCATQAASENTAACVTDPPAVNPTNSPTNTTSDGRSLNPADATALNEIDVLNAQLFSPNGDNSWLMFENLNAADNADLSVSFARTSSDPSFIDQMTLEVRGDTPDGELLGVVYLGQTGGWNTFQTKTVSVSGFQGRIYVKFVGLGGVNISDITLSDQTTAYTRSINIPQSPINSCINLGGSLEAPRNTAPNYWGLQIEAQDLATIAEAGFDSIRLPVKFSDYAQRNAPYTIDAPLLQTTDQIIDWAFSNNLKVVLDIHLYDELFIDAEAEKDRFIAIWGQIAEHYKDWWDTHLIFEIINEPIDESNAGLGMTIAKTDEFNQLALNKIRETNPDRWVILGTGNSGSLDGLRMSTPPQDNKVMLSLHYYEPFDFTHQGAEFSNPVPPFGVTWGTDLEKQNLSDEFHLIESIRRDYGMPLFVGEYGVIHNANTDGLGSDLLVPNSDRAEWTRQVTTEAKQRGYGYCYWDYATAYRAYDKEQQAWIPEILDALQ